MLIILRVKVIIYKTGKKQNRDKIIENEFSSSESSNIQRNFDITLVVRNVRIQNVTVKFQRQNIFLSMVNSFPLQSMLCFIVLS